LTAQPEHKALPCVPSGVELRFQVRIELSSQRVANPLGAQTTGLCS